MTPKPGIFPRDRLGVGGIRIVLAGAPPAFRREFGDALVDAVRQRADDVRRAGGTSAVTRYWLAQWGDLAGAVLGEWIQLVRPRPAHRAAELVTDRFLPDRERLFMDTLLSDLRYSVRALLKQPGFSAVVVLTLALGIGANTAIFSILDAVVLTPLPYEAPEELVLITDDLRTYNIPRGPLAEYEVHALRAQVELFDGIAASSGPFQSPLTSDDGDPEQIRMMGLTPGYLELLGVRPVIGRTFTPEEGAAVPPEVLQDPTIEAPLGVVLLDHDFWTRRFGGRADAVGTEVTINSRQFRIIGVMPPGFRIFTASSLGALASGKPEVYSPIEVDFAAAATGPGYMMVIGRLRDGVSVAQGREEIAAVATRLRESHERSARAEIHTTAVAWSGEISRDVRPALVALLGAVGFVILIACANVANLMLARATSRRQEIAVRAALGAQRGRIVRQVLTEGVLLAAAGGTLGLLLAAWGVRAILALQPADLPRAEAVGLSTTVLLFTLGATALAVLLFGIAPALTLSSVRGSLALNERGTGGGSQGRSRLRSALVVAEVALSLVLLVGAGLMLRSFGHLTGIDPGFRPERVLTFQVSLPFFDYRDGASRDRFMRDVLDQVAVLPGVSSAGAATALPLSGALFTGPYRTETMTDEEAGMDANFRGVSPGFFRTMGTPIVMGREFDPLEGTRDIAIVDRQLAEHTFPGEDPLGRRIRVQLPTFTGGPPDRVEVEIIGVVENVRDDGGMAAPGRRTIYFPHETVTFGGIAFAVRAAADSQDLLTRIRERVAAIDPEIPLFAVRPMQEYVDEALAPVRFTLVLIAIFGGLAMVLAAIGLYGVLSNAVRQQTRDLGVRIAFGATSGQILRRVVGRGTVMAATGIAIGLLVSVPVTRATRSLFVGVAPTDPLTLAAISLLLLSVSVLACYLPAYRASRLDPATSLRAD